MRVRKFTFTYRYEGADYGLDIEAESEAEACGRVRQMSMARYDGEVMLTIPVPAGGIILRLINWFRGSP